MVWFYNAKVHLKYAGRMANSVDPDQTAQRAVWSGSALFAQAYLSQYLEV